MARLVMSPCLIFILLKEVIKPSIHKLLVFKYYNVYVFPSYHSGLGRLESYIYSTIVIEHLLHCRIVLTLGIKKI